MDLDLVNKEIQKCSNDIKELQKKINKCYEERMERYFKLREIMEDEKNHEENLICKALLPDKLKDYQKALNDYKIFHENSKEKVANHIEKIDKNFETMTDLKNKLFNLEKANESKETQAFEMKRRKILENNIKYMKDKKLGEKVIERVEEIIKEKKTNL